MREKELVSVNALYAIVKRYKDMDIKDYLHKPASEVDPRRGHLLIAEPMLPDPNFLRTAVLILDREESGGHLGLIMNREIGANADQLLPDWEGAERIPLFCGGPVELERVFMLHRLGEVIDKSVEIMPGLYTGGDMDQLRDYIASEMPTEGLIRFYLGYGGWSNGQLTKEILDNSWGVNTHPDVADLLNGSGFEYWDREVRRLGPEYRSWLNIPQHPSLN